jgi:3-deoxy-manno-octulosonate cytidylyltransferase (CMP-KDO synthetase)
MQVVAIIPARFGSTRFPGKPLANQTGKFLIQHVCEQVTAAEKVGRCIVATDDQRIVDAVRSFGGQAAMTRADHVSGTDRIAEVVGGLDGNPDDVILNVQGDEPEIEPDYLDRLIERMVAEPTCPTATLACPFPPEVDPRDPNCVKVVCDRRQMALYFSRALIPHPRESDTGTDVEQWLLHLGVYAYRRAFLLDFAGWETSALERIERLEQLRVLDYGHTMAVAIVPHGCVGIDTPEDYEQFVARRAARECGTGVPPT